MWKKGKGAKGKRDEASKAEREEKRRLKEEDDEAKEVRAPLETLTPERKPSPPERLL